MAKRTTKADVILRDTRKRIEAVEQSYNEHVNGMNRDNQTLVLLRGIYADLEKALAPKPRGKSTPAPTQATEKKKRTRTAQPTLVQSASVESGLNDSASGELCAKCGNGETFTDHFKPSPYFHEFEGKAKAVSAA